MSSDLITLARIAAQHGVKGLVKIQPLCEDVSLIQDLSPLQSKQGPIELTLKNAMGKFILAEIKNCNSREASEALKGLELQADINNLPDIEDSDTFYYHDLIGLSVQNTQNENIGKVISVQDYGAGDLLEIRLQTGEEFLLPFTDEFVPNIAETIQIKGFEDFIER